MANSRFVTRTSGKVLRREKLQIILKVPILAAIAVVLLRSIYYFNTIKCKHLLYYPPKMYRLL